MSETYLVDDQIHELIWKSNCPVSMSKLSKHSTAVVVFFLLVEQLGKEKNNMTFGKFFPKNFVFCLL